jgi:Predicted acetyltransferase
MQVQLYSDIKKYTDDVLHILIENEIQNNLIISNCLRGIDGADTGKWIMATVIDTDGAPVLIALMTPPHNVVLYESGNNPNNGALDLLVNEFICHRIRIPGVLAEKSLACRFADKYSCSSKSNKENVKNMRIYRLDYVNKILPSSGRLRPANQDDLYFLPYWNIAFSMDCGMGMIKVPDAADKVNRLLNDNTLYVWEDRFPVSQAAMGRRTLNGAVVNAVYTPPHYRGKGYATSCVASLNQRLLDSGYKFCSLFTDLANPVSNSIYMKIGYKPVCDYDEYKLTEVAE